VKPPRGKRVGPFTAIAGGLSPVLLQLLKAVCGRRTFAFLADVCFCARVADGGVGPRKKLDGRGGCRGGDGGLVRGSLSSSPLPLLPSPPFAITRTFVSRLALTCRGRFGATREESSDSSLNRTVGTGRTSPPVRRRDPFSACRSTRGVP